MKETLKKLREQNNYSQSIIAKYLNISRQQYIKYESGDVEPSVRVIKQLSTLYKVSYAQIIDNALDENNYKVRNIKSGELVASEAVPVYCAGVSQDNCFELAQSLLTKLNIFEQLQLLSKLADLIGKNGAKKIEEKKECVKKEYEKKRTLSELELRKKVKEYTGILKGVVLDDPKDAKLEYLYKKYCL